MAFDDVTYGNYMQLCFAVIDKASLWPRRSKASAIYALTIPSYFCMRKHLSGHLSLARNHVPSILQQGPESPKAVSICDGRRCRMRLGRANHTKNWPPLLLNRS